MEHNSTFTAFECSGFILTAIVYSIGIQINYAPISRRRFDEEELKLLLLLLLFFFAFHFDVNVVVLINFFLILAYCVININQQKLNSTIRFLLTMY